MHSVIDTLIVGGETLVNVPADIETLKGIGVAENDIAALILAAEQKQALSQMIQSARVGINRSAGDTESRQGTIADVLGWQIESMSKLLVALSSANSLAEVRQAADTAGAEMATKLIKMVDSDELRLTHKLKGEQAVFNDLVHRMNVATDELAPVYAKAQEA